MVAIVIIQQLDFKGEKFTFDYSTVVFGLFVF